MGHNLLSNRDIVVPFIAVAHPFYSILGMHIHFIVYHKSDRISILITKRRVKISGKLPPPEFSGVQLCKMHIKSGSDKAEACSRADVIIPRRCINSCNQMKTHVYVYYFVESFLYRMHNEVPE